LVKLSVATFSFNYIQGGPEKTAQTLMRYNFSTAGHRVMRFPAKCSATNW